MLRAWSGETFSHAGKHYQATDYTGTPAVRPRLLIGGGGPRMLRIAGQNADIVSLVFKLDKGGMGPGDVALSNLETMGAQVERLRAAAGERFDQIELSTMIFWARITENPLQDVAENAASVGYTPEQALESMHFLYGPLEWCVEELQRRREALGLSYFVFSQFGADLGDLGRIVARLTGT